MPKPARILPSVRLVIGILKLLTGKLHMAQELVGRKTRVEDGEIFTFFRQIKNREVEFHDNQVTFVVRFSHH